MRALRQKWRGAFYFLEIFAQAALHGGAVEVVERRREHSVKLVLIISVLGDFETLEEHLVERPANLIGCPAVGIGASNSEFDRLIDELGGLFDVGVQRGERPSDRVQFAVELLLFVAEDREWDGVVVARFEEFALLAFDLELLRGEGFALLVDVLDYELQFATQELSQLFGVERFQCEPVVE
ncbi:hypothetical protein M2390_000316 [Mycetocola sp. BIGb0189]|uniref:hypothetical protein n=1 Tax=Mycetocola sp. BIGb0189 TaxID=2940604 RepID=UPI00216834C5|nr:hypothetical protein [Mycetocola sp. BIGb0189]MCS4275158.1 hypothetical protein [Mycetocola sp. BIGb0189]